MAETTRSGPQVLSLGMTRTGSASITQALTILGYKNVHHGIQAIGNPKDWEVFSRACDAFFPTLPTYNGQPFGRSDWDQVFGQCEGVTDMASFFAVPLAHAYPDAKVVLVERDIESWYASMEEAIFGTTWGWRADLIIDVFGRLMGLTGGLTIRKIMLGYYEARSADEMRAKARDRYRRHYAEVRAAITGNRLLNYDLTEGWEPLCAFLGKPVPDVPFPQANKRKEHVARVRAKQNMFFKAMGKKILRMAIPWVVGSGAVAFGIWVLRNQEHAAALRADAEAWVGVLKSTWKDAKTSLLMYTRFK
ncbi:hypothetical protein CGRA01v4_13863 [Colletotrichum graminicola]|uniref:NAD dependent epimerase/dehydratase n=1 Tax=Colletotrichum graminicola (strain M1.001 / M2 / FGSC 10212) TaxID=645133 RepID=E3QUF7_COLGM|nr:uncharacterized protein GLRG_09639 [Colletotrichum graminicola M1.001]EFQ34495.1 hypothetical protein GLRG_09639 [Colletotrichum graminicola M1.001]WDK22573.1 hypothetical protein CGRA01v4_13863 [Colletotrichum graminicola]